MKITYEQLYRSYPVFNHLLDQPLPIKTSLKFQELVESVNPYLLQIENIQNKLIEKYSEKTKEDGVVQIIEEKREDFIKELAWSELNHLRQSIESFLYSNKVTDEDEKLEKTRKILLQEKKDETDK